MRALLTSLLLIAATGAQGLELRSGETQATLLELFTSEGCSSCPPADHWFSELKDHPRLWDDLVPVAFHVDYWNYLGWEDRFASPVYAQRQRSFKSQGAARAVYTPGMMALGQEWRDWRYRQRTLPDSDEKTGVLSVSVNGDAVEARFQSETDEHTTPDFHLAVLGFGLRTPVKAGENRGELLQHDFVVLGYVRIRGPGPWQLPLPETPYAEQASRLALAAWVSPRGSVQSLQTVGGWLPN